jgi:membrane protein YqaA with SNARE-associated domain
MSIPSLLIVVGSVWKWIHRLGGPGLILLGLADNAPFMSASAGSVDIFVILLSAHRHQWWPYYAFMATVGEVLGGYLTYRLAAKGGQETFEKKVGKARAEKTYKQFEKHGFMTVCTGAILPPPFPFTPVLMAAGVMQYPRKKFFSALTAGRAVRFFARGSAMTAELLQYPLANLGSGRSGRSRQSQQGHPASGAFKLGPAFSSLRVLLC